VPEDALARLRQAAHRTLGCRGVRYREVSWLDTMPEGITDLTEIAEGEIDIGSGERDLVVETIADGVRRLAPTGAT
jgi:hypothetical protein